MTATIQKILKPSKYRAVDTSTGEHLSANFVVDPTFSLGGDQSDATSGTYWATGSDVTIDADGAPDGTGCAIFADDDDNLAAAGNCLVGFNEGAKKGYGASPLGDIRQGDKFEVTYTVSSYNTGSVRINLFSKSAAGDGNHVSGSYPIYRGATATKSANGTFTETIIVNDLIDGADYNNAIVISSVTDSDNAAMYKISNISVKRYESFGNNNHGQIYSGRGLEFDGLSDYLTTGTTFSETNHTVACWVYMNNITSDKHIFDARDSGVDGIRIMASNPSKLEYQLNSDSDNITSTVGYNSTWVRAIFTYDGTTQKIYINGVLDVSLTVSETISTTTNAFIGARNFTSATNYFDGKLSDFQAWDTAWTQSDVTFDYLNPESLVLNNGGTSLTESNLKLWYPMQGGHRGQQSYVLDGANTGLGNELVVNGGYSDTTSTDSSVSALAGWDNAGTHSGAGQRVTISNGQATIVSDGTDIRLQQTILTSGVTYEYSVDIISNDGAGGTAMRFEMGSGTAIASFSTVGTHTGYFTADNTSFRIRRTGACNVTFDNVSIKPVNDKHHATTEFFGDEMISTQANRQFGSSGQWVGYNSPTSAAIVSEKFQVVTSLEDPQTTQGAKLPIANLTAPVAGRTYRIRAKLDNVDSANLDATYKFTFGGTSETIKASDDTPSNGTITATEEEYYADVVAANSTGDLIIQIPSAANDEATTFTIDNVSVEEMGVATGWTDADQQLDIPQTALQSYNQLAWFPGSDSGTDYDVNCGSDSTIDDIFNGGGTISAWIYPTGDGTQWIVHKGSGTGPSSGWYVGVQNLSGGKFILRLDVSFDGTNGTWDTDDRVIPQGKWSHIAVKWNDDSTSNNASMYVNGEFVDVTESSTPVGTYNTDASANFLIGNSHDGTRAFGGIITEVSLWDRNLLLSHVEELYNDGMALDALTHSTANSNLKAYWRNNGLAKWTDLKNTNHGTPTNVTETLLLPAGVDASRDNQGFLMNRQKNTNSLNLPDESSGVRGSSNSGPYVFLPKAPIPSATSTVTNFSFAVWLKLTTKLNDIMTSGAVRVFDDSLTNSERGLRVQINQNNVIYTYVNWGSSSQNSIYTDFDLDNLDNGTVTNPHSFGTDGEWNGTQTTITGVGINQYSDGASGSNFENEWIHYAVTFDHDREESQTSETGDHTSNGSSGITNRAPFYSFINGIIIGKEGKEADDNQATADSRGIQAGNNPMLIGNDMNTAGTGPGNDGNTFPGEIDDLLFYNKTLTARDILRIYKAGKRSHR